MPTFDGKAEDLKEWSRKTRDKLEKFRPEMHETILAKEVKWSLDLHGTT